MIARKRMKKLSLKTNWFNTSSQKNISKEYSQLLQSLFLSNICLIQIQSTQE
jgi:hypothetical protein